MTVTKMAAEIEIGHHVIQDVVEGLGYHKVCAFWIPHLLTEEHKLQ
jgi:hypothetical protein